MKFKIIHLQKNEDKHYPGSTIVNLIQKSVLEEPAMEGRSDAYPVSILICGTCACFFK